MPENANRMVGVILAAGKGTRIYPFSETLPKPVMPVGNRPLLEHQIDIMRASGLSEVYIVIGHLGYAVVDALKDVSRDGMKIHFVEQVGTLGIAHALGKLEPVVNSPFVLFLGDIYFVTDSLRPAMDEVLSQAVNANLISKIERDPEMIKRNFAIIEEARGVVRQVIEKPRYAKTNLKGCGLYVFDQHIFDAIRRTPRTAMRDEYEITDSIQILIDDDHVVCHQPVVKLDLNLTVPDDLLTINLLHLQQCGVSNIIGEGVEMPEGTTIENSVIGAGVTIRHPIAIRNSMVFAQATVDSDVNLDHVIVEGRNTVHCKPKVMSWLQAAS
jgi:NDP-sugar pyrophosphorylase family protein